MIALGRHAPRQDPRRSLVAGRNLGPGFYLGTMAATVLGGASTIGTVRLATSMASPASGCAARSASASSASACSWPSRC